MDMLSKFSITYSLNISRLYQENVRIVRVPVKIGIGCNHNYYCMYYNIKIKKQLNKWRWLYYLITLYNALFCNIHRGIVMNLHTVKENYVIRRYVRS